MKHRKPERRAGWLLRAALVVPALLVGGYLLWGDGTPADSDGAEVAGLTPPASPSPSPRPSRPVERKRSTRPAPQPPPSSGFTERLESQRPRRGTERRFLEDLRRLAREDPGAFRKRVLEILAGEGPLPEKVAALRACCEGPTAPWLEPFADVLRDPSAPLELGDFAVGYLGEKANNSAETRAVLARYLDAGLAPVRRRCTAVFAVLRWGSETEVHGRRSYLYAERDPSVVGRAAQALAESSTRSARLVLEDLRKTHPSRAVRRQLEAIADRR